ncbi:hypothetical protein SISSUDRAFT_1062390 [Sistotremastrum suecicum HHB10207 ss-3]|uniref:Uncharacterized protein n=1 Tax=Sistotremastrum suecicum HHB10207 ss-3 TaxID=1314776 RepID=A0A166D025_9AGAM|nr:hypothetical protein SISSUDRAFT_1062390 [Sistotremastrum suecicum HHB10207 ss-3]
MFHSPVPPGDTAYAATPAYPPTPFSAQGVPLGINLPPPPPPIFASAQEARKRGIQFWTKREWLNHRREKKGADDRERKQGPGALSRGENNLNHYIEELDGGPVDGTRVGEMKLYARSLWWSWGIRAEVPSQFRKNADIKFMEYYDYSMADKFVELRACEGYWKGVELGASIYSKWYNETGKALVQERRAQEKGPKRGADEVFDIRKLGAKKQRRERERES